MIEVEIWVFCLFQSYFYVYEFRVLVSRCFFRGSKNVSVSKRATDLSVGRVQMR